MSASDERLARLLERWGTSLELHQRYLELDDTAYARVQAWPKHQRPNRWLIDLARTRLATLQGLLAGRVERGDADFSQGLELMAFLTTLLGSEHVERSIPLAHPPTADAAPRAPARAAGRPSPPTRRRQAPAPPAARTATGSKTRSPPSARPDRHGAPDAAAAIPPELEKMSAKVIADAVRFLKWGREWPQLAGLIARLADRPGERDVWTILRKHRDSIESQARRPSD